MNIYGYLPTSLIEWPGKVSSVIFTGGCNFRCPYCQNSELVGGLEKLNKIPWEDILKDLRLRKKWVDAVCFTGGEPTLQKNLADILGDLKKIGFLTQLETNGSMPKMLKNLLERQLLDRITMDIKTDLARYEKVADMQKINKLDIVESIELIKSSGIASEFRTTVVPTIVAEAEINEIGKILQGANRLVLQQFQNKNVSLLDAKMAEVKPYSKNVLNNFAKILRKNIKKVEVKV